MRGTSPRPVNTRERLSQMLSGQVVVRSDMHCDSAIAISLMGKMDVQPRDAFLLTENM
jgi:hypothetical protein